jgi:hypothetical protein
MHLVHGEFPEHLSAFITREQYWEAVSRLGREISDSRRCSCFAIMPILLLGIASMAVYIYFTQDAAYAILIGASTMASCIVVACCLEARLNRRIRRILAANQELTPGFEWFIQEKRSGERTITYTRYGSTGQTHSYSFALIIERRAGGDSLL